MNKTYIIYFLLLCFLALCLKSCSDKRKYENRISVLDDTTHFYETKYGQEVASKRAIQISSRSLKKRLIEKNDSLKEVIRSFKTLHTATQIVTRTKIDTITITYTDTIPFVFTRDFSVTDKFYFIGGTSNHTGVVIDSLVVPNKISIFTGIKKVSWGKEEIVTDVVHSNPYVKTTKLSTYNTRRIKRFGLGGFVGYDLINNKPSIGIGLTYNVIQF